MKGLVMIRPAVFVREGQPVQLEDGTRWEGYGDADTWTWRQLEPAPGRPPAQEVPRCLLLRRGYDRPLGTYRKRRWGQTGRGA